MLLLTALICLVLARVGEAAISDFDGDLIAYWKLDEIDVSDNTPAEVGSYTASVETSGGDAVTVTSPGRVDDAFGFTGMGADRVKTDGTVPVGTSFSVSAWVRVDATPVVFSYRRIVETDYQTAFFLGENNGAPSVYTFIVDANDNGGLPAAELHGPQVAISSNWVHVAGTYDSASTTAKLYVNNVVATDTNVTAPGLSFLNVSIGSSASAADCWYGDIDEVRIYNRALTAGEIDDLYKNNTAPSALSLTIY
jgi:hypothetical protein